MLYIKSLKTILILFIILLSIFLSNKQINAAGNLEDASDLLNNNQTSMPGVNHIVSFGIPFDSDMIISSDYIIIDLPYFSAITVADNITGTYFGTPQYSLDGTQVKITNIAIPPGEEITILGITATNPSHQSLFDVSVIISEDEAGTLIKNISNFSASTWGGEISVSATISPPVSSVTFSGYSAPGTIINITEAGSAIGTDTTSPVGAFVKYITGVSPITHTYTIYGVDTKSRTTSHVVVPIYTPVYQNTAVSNVLLSPTMEISASSVVQGEDFVASGSAIPGGQISLFTESPLKTYSASAGALGLWNYTVANTSEYNPGDYIIYGMVQNFGGSQSLFSPGLQFTVTATTSGSPAGCDISQGDLTCDSNVNLNDFSVLMYYWGTSNAAADINGDSAVNLTDFSIMMYYWGS